MLEIFRPNFRFFSNGHEPFDSKENIGTTLTIRFLIGGMNGGKENIDRG